MKRKLSTRKKPRLSVVPEVPQYYTFAAPLPPGVTAEKCIALHVNDRSLEGFGIFPDDECFVHLEGEVQTGDFILWRMVDDPEGTSYIRRFYTAPGDRVRLERTEDGERKALVYKREEVVIKGRVFRVERNGLVVKTFPSREGE